MNKQLKSVIFVLSLVLSGFGLSAQNSVGISPNNAPSDPSAILDVQSTNQGVLIPRMTQIQRDAIASPATGLMIYQTDNTPGFYYNAGTPTVKDWKAIGGAGGSTFPNVEVSDKATANQTITDKANANPPTFSTLLFSGTNSTNASLSSGNTWNGNTFTVGAGNAGWYQVSAQVVGVQTTGSNTNMVTSTGIIFILDKNNFVSNTPGLQQAPVHASSSTNNTQYPLAISTNAQTVLTGGNYFRNANTINTVVYLAAGDFITLRGVSISQTLNAITSNDGSTRIEIVRVK